MRRCLVLLFLTVCLAALAFGAEPKVETIGAFTGSAPDAVKAALADKGYRLRLADGTVGAEIWPAKTVDAGHNSSGSALYPALQNGTFVGVISFPSGGGDYRGQKIAAGTYTMRYQVLPGDGNHMGVSPDPDFFLLLPVAADTSISMRIPYIGMMNLSKKAAGTGHPAAFALAAAEGACPGAVSGENRTVLVFPLSIGGQTTPVGMVVVGSAE